MMPADLAQVQADFDRIALLSPEGELDNNARFHAHLLRHVPRPCRRALDVGCGTGSFTRLLASRCDRVTAIDLSPRMIEVARERSRGLANVDFVQADVTSHDLGREQFDCISSIATLHHLPIDDILPRLRRALAPRGVLLVVDLFHPHGPLDLTYSCASAAVHVAQRLLHPRCLRVSLEARRAWAEHGARDSYLTMAGARANYGAHLPGARVRRHLMWRYSAIYCKPT
jgi:ubiquinone/menaquinone biosynthesis C-methylase UbiE